MKRPGAPQKAGLRERKRLKTRQRIIEAASSLFMEKGFDATTVDEIADAAEVSKRTFFDYFPSKEDVVVAWQDEFGQALAAAVRARPKEEPLIRVVEEALVSSVAAASTPQSIAMDMLVRTTPILQAREQLKFAKLEATLSEALYPRVNDEFGRLRARLLAMVVVGGLRIGSEGIWHIRNAKGDPADYARTGFRALLQIVLDIANQYPKP